MAREHQTSARTEFLGVKWQPRRAKGTDGWAGGRGGGSSARALRLDDWKSINNN
jgi:hypothetical protein